jgi:acetyltransferase
MLWTASEKDVTGLPMLQRSARVPVFFRAENLAKAIRASMHFHNTRARYLQRTKPDAAIEPETIAGLSIAGRTGTLGLSESLELLAHVGIATSQAKLAHSSDEAVALAETIGYPIVLKVDSPDLPHKTDLGLVKVGLSSKSEVEQAFRDLDARVKALNSPASINGFLVQEMVRGGNEVIIGVKAEPQLGLVLLFGLGGVFTEAMKDFSLRVCPVTRDDVRDMIREIRGFKLLEGFRGSPPADLDALESAVLNTARLATSLKGQIAEIDINPLLVLPRGQGVRAIDALFILGRNEATR